MSGPEAPAAWKILVSAWPRNATERWVVCDFPEKVVRVKLTPAEAREISALLFLLAEQLDPTAPECSPAARATQHLLVREDVEERLRGQVLSALMDLGDEPEQIAARLLTLGHRGRRNSSLCPLRQYLALRFPGWHVEVGAAFVRLQSASGADWTASCALPAPVSRFPTRFDYEGHFPELLEPESLGGDLETT